MCYHDISIVISLSIDTIYTDSLIFLPLNNILLISLQGLFHISYPNTLERLSL